MLTLEQRLDNVIRWLTLFGGSDDSAAITLRQVQARLATLEAVAQAARGEACQDQDERETCTAVLCQALAALDALEGGRDA